MRRMAVAACIGVVMVAVEGLGFARAAPRLVPERCTYSPFAWSVASKRAVRKAQVDKPYAAVTADERDPADPRCTVCSEDQVEIDPRALGISGVAPIHLCWVHAERVRDALLAVARSGQFEIVELEGYRPGRTRGAVVGGLRTEWSNHAFGAAIDINARHNGLYRACDVPRVTPAAIRRCRLGVGGPWKPDVHPRKSIVRGGVVYEAFTRGAGWRWGGEIPGTTKDLMHFSATGF